MTEETWIHEDGEDAQHTHVFPVGVDSIGEGFEGSTVQGTTDDGEPSSIEPQEPLPEDATETEKELVEAKEEE